MREPATAARGSCGSSAPNQADRAASSIRRVGEAVRSPDRPGVRGVHVVLPEGEPGGALGGTRRRGLDVPTVPNREAQQSPQDARAVVTPGEVVVQQTADHGRIEIPQALQSCGRELVLDHAAQLVTQPRSGRADEPPLRCAEMLLRTAWLQRALPQLLVLPRAHLNAVRE